MTIELEAQVIKEEEQKLASGLLAQVIGSDGELDGEDVVPGFKLAVNKLFG